MSNIDNSIKDKEVTDVKSIDEVTDVKSIDEVTDVKSVDEVTDVKSVDEVTDVKSVDEVTDVKSIDEVTDVKSIDEVTDVKSVDEVTDVEVENDSEEEEVEENQYENINLKGNESHEFKAEISQLMNLIINSFYSNKEIFMRELISNSSDALNKMRHNDLTKNNVKDVKDYYINITPYKDTKMLVIEDNGIGMTKEELTTNIGIIANSGTKKFIEKMEQGEKKADMIGQFGVGFYSAFLVADRVQLITKSEDSDNIYMWDSTASGTYTISEVVDTELVKDFKRGTKILLHLKEEETKYLEEERIRTIVKKHSQFITYDIKVSVYGKSKKVKEWEILNMDKPIWCKKSSEVTDDEYKSLYKNISNDYQDCLSYKHFSAEGTVEFKGILYIPSHPPFEMNKETNKFKLYVKRVYIMDNCKDLIPEWLSFIHGIVDTDDLPLNVSREILQHNRMIKIMKKKIILKTIELLEEMSSNEEVYNGFYNNFSKNLKLGVYEEGDDIKEKLGKQLRFYTNKSNKLKSIEQYIGDMKEGQDKIYYITGESIEFVNNSVFLEGLNKKGYEVLYLVDTIDEYMMNNFKKYGDYEFLSVTKEELKKEEDKNETDDLLCNKMKEYLNDNVEKVVLSNRFVDSPCCLVSGSYGISANMERIMKAQALNNQMVQTSKKILEINKDHNIVKSLKKNLENNRNEDELKDLVYLLYDIACLSSGFTINDTNNFTKKLYNILEIGMGYSEETQEEVQEEAQEETNEETNEMEKVD